MTQTRPQNSRIRPKLSSIPRRNDEASQLLEMHKLALEKSRLEAELKRMALREAVVQERLLTIQEQMDERVKTTCSRLGTPDAPATNGTSTPLTVPLPSAQPRGVFDLLNMEY